MMSMPGEVAGVEFKKDEEYILSRGSRKNITEVEENIADFGYSFSYNDIDEKEFYSWGNRIMSLLAVASIFKIEKGNIGDIGRQTVDKSFFSKIKSKYLKSTKQILTEICQDWRKTSTIGRLELKEINKKEAVIALYNLDFHPIFCDYFCGYLAEAVSLSEGVEAKCVEENCYFKGDCDFHKFVVKW